MSAPKFDKTKPYGTVHGDENGCKYSQNGLLFGANGELHVPPAAEAAAVPAADMESRIAAAVAAAVAEHAKNTDKIVAAAIGAALAAQKKAA